MEQRGDLIPVVLITSDPEWEKGIREFLINSGRVHLVRVFASPDQAVQLLPHVRPSPEIVLLTENAGGVPELSTCRQISQMMPQAAVILVVSDTLFDDPRYLRSAMASGADDVLRMTRPMRFQGWIESMERVRDLLRARTVATRRETGRVVAVFSLKGGVGKTTLALGLADRLAAAPPEPFRVVYVDLNWHAGMTETLVGHPASRSWLESLDFQNGPRPLSTPSLPGPVRRYGSTSWLPRVRRITTACCGISSSSIACPRRRRRSWTALPGCFPMDGRWKTRSCRM